MFTNLLENILTLVPVPICILSTKETTIRKLTESNTHVIYTSPEIFNTFRIGTEGQSPLEWSSFVLPADREKFFENINGETVFKFRCRFFNQDRGVSYVHFEGKVIEDSGVKYVYMVLSDLTELANITRRLGQIHQLSDKILQQLPLPVLWKDRRGHILKINKILERKLGIDSLSLHGCKVEEVFTADLDESLNNNDLKHEGFNATLGDGLRIDKVSYNTDDCFTRNVLELTVNTEVNYEV